MASLVLALFEMPEESEESELGELTAEINRALQTTDIAKVCAAIGNAVRLHNASEIARKAGIERPSVYRAFGSAGSPNFTTVVRVLDAMGFRLKLLPRQKGKRIAKRQKRTVSSS
jgi:probable addiction module antidote protein